MNIRCLKKKKGKGGRRVTCSSCSVTSLSTPIHPEVTSIHTIDDTTVTVLFRCCGGS